MHRYGNAAGDSGVVAYGITGDAILVRFRNGETYRYDAAVPGAVHVARMKTLARAGRGLGTYISRHVGSRYAAKL